MRIIEDTADTTGVWGNPQAGGWFLATIALSEAGPDASCAVTFKKRWAGETEERPVVDADDVAVELSHAHPEHLIMIAKGEEVEATRTGGTKKIHCDIRQVPS